MLSGILAPNHTTGENTMPDAQMMSFELNEEMLNTIEEEFSPEKIATRFAEAVAGKSREEADRIGGEIFTRYGTDLMKRSYELGEEYPDRTYEVIKEAAEDTGAFTFPLVPQRFIEIALLSIQHISTVPVIVNNAGELVFQVKECKIYDQIMTKAGEDVAGQLTCKNGCIKAWETIFARFGFQDVAVGMNAATNKEGYCEFKITR
jgi:hypothetical protein